MRAGGKIGICSPISLVALKSFLFPEEALRMENFSGLLAPAVDAVVKELINTGHQVEIFTLDKKATRVETFRGESLTIHVGRYRSSPKTRGLTFFHAEISDLREAIKCAKLAVIHAHWTYEFALAALAAECPIVCTVRDIAEEIYRISPNPYRYIRLWMNRYLFLHQKRIIWVANSTYTKEMLHRHHPRLDPIVIPNPVGIRPGRPKTRGADGCRIITISNDWSRRKNMCAILKAFQLVRKGMPKAELTMVGGAFTEADGNVKELRKSQPELLEGVELAGAIPHDKLPAILSNKTVMVHPSLEESFGNTLIEAMACGLPVIGGEKSGAVPWVLDYGNAGCLCDVLDPETIARSIIDLVNNDAVYKRLSAAGFERATTYFSVAHVAEMTLNVYDKAVEG